VYRLVNEKKKAKAQQKAVEPNKEDDRWAFISDRKISAFTGQNNGNATDIVHISILILC
jgi:hypothetical protein